jgi:hypothetical protein
MKKVSPTPAQVKTASCEDCLHFSEADDLSPEGIVVGTCRRFPRQFAAVGGVDRWLFPLHFETDYCAELSYKGKGLDS